MSGILESRIEEIRARDTASRPGGLFLIKQKDPPDREVIYAFTDRFELLMIVDSLQGQLDMANHAIRVLQLELGIK